MPPAPCFEALHNSLTIPPTVTTSAPPPPPASDPLETQAGKVQEAQVRWGKGGGKERDGLVPTPHSPGGGDRRESYPRALSSQPQFLAPLPSSASWGMVNSEGCQRRVCGLNPRPALLNFPLSLLLPLPRSLLNLIYAAPGRDRHPTWSLNSRISWTSDWKMILQGDFETSSGHCGSPGETLWGHRDSSQSLPWRNPQASLGVRLR